MQRQVDCMHIYHLTWAGFTLLILIWGQCEGLTTGISAEETTPTLFLFPSPTHINSTTSLLNREFSGQPHTMRLCLRLSCTETKKTSCLTPTTTLWGRRRREDTEGRSVAIRVNTRLKTISRKSFPPALAGRGSFGNSQPLPLSRAGDKYIKVRA